MADFPHSFTAVVLLADSQRGPRCHSRPNAGSPGSRVSLFRACAGSRTTRGRNSSCDDDLFRVAFRDKRRRQPPEVILLSRLNTRPTRYPVNASPLPLRATTHDSGPMWFATPSSDGTCTRKTYRFVPAHRMVKIIQCASRSRLHLLTRRTLRRTFPGLTRRGVLSALPTTKFAVAASTFASTRIHGLSTLTALSTLTLDLR